MTNTQINTVITSPIITITTKLGFQAPVYKLPEEASETKKKKNYKQKNRNRTLSAKLK